MAYRMVVRGITDTADVLAGKLSSVSPGRVRLGYYGTHSEEIRRDGPSEEKVIRIVHLQYRSREDFARSLHWLPPLMSRHCSVRVTKVGGVARGLLLLYIQS